MYLRDDLSRGNYRIKKIVEEFLHSSMEQDIPIARNVWGLDERTLPDIVSYNFDHPSEILEYPSIGAYLTNTDRFTDWEPTETGALEVTYDAELTIYIATRTAYMGVDADGIDWWEEPSKESAIRQRDDYVSLIRKAVNRSRSFGTAGNQYPIVADLTSWRESYDDPYKVGDGRNPRWVCSGMINMNVKCTDKSFEFDRGIVGTTPNIQVVRM